MMRDDMINYKGAWIYPVVDGYEANLRGFHYDGLTLDELKAKIDVAVETDDPGQTLKLYSASPDYARVSFMNEDEEFEDGLEYVVVYHLAEPEEDDSFEDISKKEVIITAPDFETAVKYAQQYLRKMCAKEETKDLWRDAEILSIEQR